MNYTYKDISCNQITTGVSEESIYYRGFYFTNTGYNNSKPLYFGYKVNDLSISNVCTAAYINVTDSSIVAIPSGVKHMRFTGIGGGGGAGGRGGRARLVMSEPSTAYGGIGGPGGNSKYGYVNEISIGSATNVNIVIGAGGNGGAMGANDNTADSDDRATASAGDPGGPGGSTYFNLSGTTIYCSNGGSGGNGGNGGSVRDAPGANISDPGNDGNTGASGICPDSNNGPWYSVTGPGKGGPKENKDIGNPGLKGWAQIIWLYE